MSATGERRKIAVDFDGTIVENQYPSIGRERPFALRTLRALQDRGFILVLWTCRTGSDLDAAVDFCRKGGVEFYAVNENYDGEMEHGECPRKLDVDIYIDDRNIGGLPSWGEIYQSLTGEGSEQARDKKGGKEKGLWQKIRKWISSQ
ncbi:MAG: BT0820 family HAD-type phosphatase [Marinilabiliaceae bacterium]